MNDHKFDLIINGGGLVGASLACALASNGFRVAIIESQDCDSLQHPSFDARAIALTYSSGVIFSNLSVWQNLKREKATTISKIVVSDESGGGQVQLTASDVGYEALGWNVDARELGQQLYRVLSESANITLFFANQIQQLEIDRNQVRAEVSSTDSFERHRLTADVLVVADGSNSALRDQLQFKLRKSQYQQSALVFRVDTDQENLNNAYEHFCRAGPLALLPVGDTGYSVVWTNEPEFLGQLMRLSRKDLLTKLQAHFGDRVGQFRQMLGERKAYPLQLSYLTKNIRPSVVVVGNASHTVHPVAGQGFNLALRDIAALVDVLCKARSRGWPIGSYDVLSKYENWRTREGRKVTWFTDGMVRLFANQLPILTPTRNLGLDLLQVLPPLKRQLLMRTMGIYGRQPSLASDLPSGHS